MKFALEGRTLNPSFSRPSTVYLRFSMMVLQLALVYASSERIPMPMALVMELMLYGLVEYLMAFRSEMICPEPIP